MRAAMKPNDGGPAHPTHRMLATGHVASSHGMSVRDFFAGQALVGMLASPILDTTDVEAVASAIYDYADAALVERDRPVYIGEAEASHG
jgi:hypothetical protein